MLVSCIRHSVGCKDKTGFLDLNEVSFAASEPGRRTYMFGAGKAFDSIYVKNVRRADWLESLQKKKKGERGKKGRGKKKS